MNHCTVCLSEDLRPGFDVATYTLSRCNRCGHLWVSAGVTPDALDAAYGEDYYAAGNTEGAAGYTDYLRDAAVRSRGFRERLAHIERRLPQRGRLLDYGCAVGLFVKVAVDAGWDAVGYERSEWAASYGRRELGLNIVVGDGTGGLPFDTTFDVVTMWDVVEHLDDPRGVIGSAASLLQPGGLLALNTVNGSSTGAKLAGEDWRHIAPPHHLQYFTRESLHRLLDELGFDVVSGLVRGVMFGADKHSGTLRGPKAWIENAVTHWRAVPIASRLNLLDEIEVLAVKR